MRDIDQFIDEVLFKESDQYKLIYETVLQEMAPEARKEIKGLWIPSNSGVAAEYAFAISLKKYLKTPEILFPIGSQIDNEVNISTIEETIKQFYFESIKKDKEKQEQKKAEIEKRPIQPLPPSELKKIQDIADDNTNSLIKKTDLYVIQRFDDLEYVTQLDKKNIKSIRLVGQHSSEYMTSADVELLSVNDQGIQQKFKVSLKASSEYIYRLGGLIPDPEQSVAVQKAVNDFNTTISLPTIYRLEGGGYKRLYAIFGLPDPDLSNIASDIKTWDFIRKDFKDKFNSKYVNSNETKKFFTALSNIITRADNDVYMLSDIKKPNFSVLPSLLNKFVSNFNVLEAFIPPSRYKKQPVAPTPVMITRPKGSPKKGSHGSEADLKTSGEYTYIEPEKPKNVLRSLGFSKSRGLEEANKKNIDESDRIAIKISFAENNVTNFTLNNIKNINNLDDTQKQAIEKLTAKNNEEAEKLYFNFLSDIKDLEQYQIPNELKKFIGDFENARKEFEKIIEDTFLELSKQPKLIFIKLESEKSLRIGIYDGLYIISKLNRIFSFLEKEDKFKNLKKCFDLLLPSKDEFLEVITNPPQKTNESLFESLILEALDEKELNKVIKKVSSSNAEGFVSALPSNKTNNSIAVRFKDDDSIDSGIKKIKSSLKSSGYQLEDQRVLKFDQNRDTTDVIKNGEVVARLFFRADIKERQGLAYEHIIGSVLTGYITDQLKNRIDLPPDASDEQVNEKLNSEKFKHLYDSAKKAAPIIEKKIGKVVKAESVGSTNNKADFVLQTQDGKTVGLSAKYAAGEKDNEYKMNKVLGFGTEDESLVHNPKGIPWWVVGRRTFLKKLQDQTGQFKGKSYDPDYETLDAPAWMKSAKEKHPDIYKETMEEVYGAVRNILTRNLRRMKIKDLVSFVMEADLGKEEERENYDMFIKVVDGPSGLSVNEINIVHQDTTNFGNLNPEEIVVQDRSDIIIKLPGFQELKINSVKFKSDMLSSKAGDLKIKTR